ncbi:MAG: AI-2E family transporter [Chloroflexi bacterium]|nr:AI-2E family transporter [Chloroflexota bacterium]
METNRWLRALLILLVIIAGYYLLSILWQIGTYLADIILLFFLAWLLAFTLAPLARLLKRSRLVPWWLSVASVFIALLLALVLLVFLVAPASLSQVAEFGKMLPTYVETTPEILSNAQKWLNSHGIALQIASLYERQTVTQWAQGLGAALAQYALGAAQGAAFVLIEAMIVLVLSFYIMLDGARIFESVLKLLPGQYREDARTFRASVERIFGGFIRGSLVMAFTYGAVTALVMSLQGLSFVLPVSAFSGAMIMIPFIGPIIAVVPPVIVAAFTGSFGTVLFVLISLLVLQQVMLQVVYPKLMSESVGMHPLLVFLAVLVGAKMAGVWGILFGVPVLAAFYSMAVFFYERTNSKGTQSG